MTAALLMMNKSLEMVLYSIDREVCFNSITEMRQVRHKHLCKCKLACHFFPTLLKSVSVDVVDGVEWGSAGLFEAASSHMQYCVNNIRGTSSQRHGNGWGLTGGGGGFWHEILLCNRTKGSREDEPRLNPFGGKKSGGAEREDER